MVYALPPILHHPPGLFILFFTEMWERFSFYGMRALLVLYMTGQLLAEPERLQRIWGFASLRDTLGGIYGELGNQALASHIYGLYTGLVYLTPVLGGLLADRWLGPRRTVIAGAVLMMAGHFLMAVESWFLPALGLLILGSGCFKPNISTQVGSLYPPGDSRRDGAFTLFYMGINLGAFLAPLLCGTLGQRYGWHYGFAAAGVGMFAGLCIYLAGGRYLPVATPPAAAAAVPALDKADRRAIAALMLLALLNILFWAVYEQQGNTLQLFAEHNTDRHICGWEMPSTWFQALNPVLIMLLAPWLDRLWAWLAGRGGEPSSVAKMAAGAGLLGLSFLVLVLAADGMQAHQRINFLWLVACTLVYTLGELLLSPVGLSLVTKVAPPGLLGRLMGVWFLSAFFGNYLSGYLGSFYERLPRERFFLLLAVLGLATGLMILLLKPVLNRAIGQREGRPGRNLC